MEDFVGNKRLITAKRLKQLSGKSTARGLLQAGSHIGAILLSGLVLAQTWGTLWAIPVFMLHGMMINFLYAGQHELSHWTVFKPKKWNDRLGHTFGFILLVPREGDRLEHFYHHRHTNDLEKDAEIVGSKPFTLVTYIMYALGPSYWYGRFDEIIRRAFGVSDEPCLKPRERDQVQSEARRYLAGYALIAAISVATGSWAAVIYWLAPMFAMKMVQQCQNITEHTGMPHIDNLLENTRTIKTNFFLRWLAWNMPYHTAHHNYPSVPFWRLPELHAELVAGMGHEPETIGYLTFHKHMLKKLWKEGHSRYAGADIRSY